MESRSSKFDRVPLVIGVTGHRDLRKQDIAVLEREIQLIFSRLRREYFGDKAETPFVVISALAEGADRIAARAALAEGAQLVAPLPMPTDEYRRDFEPGLTAGAAAEFDDLLAQAIHAPVVPFTPGNSLEAVRADSAKRAEQYQAVGKFIVEHSDLLIALWDGDDGARPAGGTAEVIAFKRHGIPLALNESAQGSLDGSEIGPVIHVLTPRDRPTTAAAEVSVRPWGMDIVRQSSGGTAGRLLSGLSKSLSFASAADSEADDLQMPPEELRELQAWITFGVLAGITRDFNDEAAGLSESGGGTGGWRRSIDELFTDRQTGLVDPKARERGLSAAGSWCRLYGIADALAQPRQAQFKRDWLVLLFLGFVSFALLAVVHDERISSYILSLYVFVMALISVIHYVAKRRRDQERYLDYRALAEGLRVAVFWNILGIEARGPEAFYPTGQHGRAVPAVIGTLACNYPIKQPNELSWVRNCLRTLELLQRPGRIEPRKEFDPEAHAIARQFWVRGELLYFTHQGRRHDHRAEVLEGMAVGFLILTTALCVPAAIWAHPKMLHDALIAMIGIFPGVAAMLLGYSERLALNAQARQYDRVRGLFKRAYELLPERVTESSSHQLRSLYLALGVEAMKENADWVAIYRQRPLRPVQ